MESYSFLSIGSPHNSLNDLSDSGDNACLGKRAAKASPTGTLPQVGIGFRLANIFCGNPHQPPSWFAMGGGCVACVKTRISALFPGRYPIEVGSTSARPQFLYFRPLPQGQGSVQPIFMIEPCCR